MVSEVTNTTECGVAGPVQNIRVSASNSNSLSYAWNIPSAVNGVPSTIRYSVSTTLLYSPLQLVISSHEISNFFYVTGNTRVL